jgi:hypothetical protein
MRVTGAKSFRGRLALVADTLSTDQDKEKRVRNRRSTSEEPGDRSVSRVPEPIANQRQVLAADEDLAGNHVCGHIQDTRI